VAGNNERSGGEILRLEERSRKSGVNETSFLNDLRSEVAGSKKTTKSEEEKKMWTGTEA